MTLSRSRRYVATLSLTLTLSVSPLVHAASPAPNSSVVTDPFHGALQSSVTIEVPSFHGLEPRLSLSYSSSGGSSFAGVGWTLGSIGTIERAWPGQGAPRYSGWDIFLLDGQELVPCASGMVATSCAAGGTHTTKIESYRRIVFAPSTNTWIVTRSDGVRETYAPSYVVAHGVFRWVLAAVEDLRGNRVAYGWTCDPAADCYPSSISYGPYRIRLFTEPRPDVRSFANGEYIGQTRWRLRSILVEIAAGAAISAYKLSYITSAGTSRSLLTSVQRYGRDVAIDPAGAITGGTTLPAVSFEYQPDPASGTFVLVAGSAPTPPGTVEEVTWFKQRCSRSSGSVLWKEQDLCPGNAWNAGASSTRAIAAGDGYMEFSDGNLPWWHGALVAGLSSNDADPGFGDIDFGLQLVQDPSTYENTLYVVERGVLRAEVGAWSQDDVFRVSVENGYVVYRRNGGWLYTSAASPTFPLRAVAALHDADVSGVRAVRIAGALVDLAGWCVDGTRAQGDYDGDGRTDLLCVQGQTIQVRRGDGSAFGAATTWLVSTLWNQGQGDFNADGKTDLYGMDLFSGEFRVALSTGTAFAAPASWGSNGVCRVDANQFQIATGDFNRDGRTDVLCRRQAGDASDGVWVGLSTGTSFSHSRWRDGCGLDRIAFATDMNGDGRDDLACITAFGPNAGAVAVSHAVGNQFEPTELVGASVGPGQCAAERWQAGDYNADGKADLACADSGRIWLSTGHGFAPQSPSTAFCPAGDLLTGDVNGDGLSDWICNQPNAPANDIEVRLGTGTGFAPAAVWLASWCLGGVVAADLDGDRKTDLTCDEAVRQIARAGTAGAIPDLLTTWRNGFGGATTVTYVPSSQFVNANNPPVVPVVSSMSTSDGRGGTAVTRYVYEGGLMDRQERRYLGFRHVAETRPCNTAPCPQRHLYFMQDYGSLAKVEREERRDGVGQLLRATDHVYTTNGHVVPYTSLETATRETWQDAGGRVKQTHVTHEHDAFGNARRTIEHGDVDAVGDERRIERMFFASTTAFIVGRVAAESRFSGTSGGALLGQTLYQYDGASRWDVPPTRGEVTGVLRWLDATNAYVRAENGYDAWGNVVSSTDETGLVSTTAYDAVHHLFPIRNTNPAGESTSAAWDIGCGHPSQEIDPNGGATAYSYDPLCRPIRIDRPLGDYEATSYLAFGDPSLQRVQVRRPRPAARFDAELVSEEFFDGLQRAYRKRSSGPNFGQWIDEITSYSPASAIASHSAPYYTGEAPQLTVIERDALDRITATVLPDGTRFTFRHDAWSTTVTDPHGHAEQTEYDAYDRAVSRTHVSQDLGKLATTYGYDHSGNLVSMRDPGGHLVTWTFDSLGRQVRQDDPDSGAKLTTYDAAGRILTETDATGQTTVRTYAGGRLATRTTGNGTAGLRYGEARPGAANVGRLTSVVDPSSSVRYDYDALGRRIRVARTFGSAEYVEERRYAPAGQLVGITYPDGDAIGTPTAPLDYDRAGRLRAIPGIVVELVYDASGRPLRQENANGTTTTWSRDPRRGWVSRIITKGSTLVQDVAYTYDGAAVLTAASSPFPRESATYRYDGMHRLLEATTPDPADNERYAYDVAGNLTYNARVGSYTYPGPGMARPHAPLEIAGSQYAYDASGRLLSGGGRTFTWNADGLPARIDDTSFVYDAEGARLEKRSAASTSLYPVGVDYEVTDGVATKYASTPHGLVAKRVGGTTYWLHRDRLGSVQAITDATGAVVERFAYTSYGDLLEAAAPHAEARDYLGQRRDAETGLSYLHARYYDSRTAVFVSPDPSHPSRPGVGPNRYAYAHGSPTNLIDPTGLDTDNLFQETIEVVASVGGISLPSAIAHLIFLDMFSSRGSSSTQQQERGLEPTTSTETTCNAAGTECCTNGVCQKIVPVEVTAEAPLDWLLTTIGELGRPTTWGEKAEQTIEIVTTIGTAKAAAGVAQAATPKKARDVVLRYLGWRTPRQLIDDGVRLLFDEPSLKDLIDANIKPHECSLRRCGRPD